MPIDLDAALSADPVVREISWTPADVLLYHLSLGAGSTPGRPELGLTYERGLSVLPTFGLVAGGGPSSGRLTLPGMRLPGIDIDLRKVLHGGQRIEVHRPLPTEGSARTSQRVADVIDLGQGRAAVVELETSAEDGDGPLWTQTSQIWARGEGGFDGSAPRSDGVRLPERAADLRVTASTGANQAMLYRLNGDYNPLHIDPEFARGAGLDGPILHGLATLGIAAKAIVDAVAGGEVTRLTGIEARFAGMVRPGQQVAVEIWTATEGEVLFRASVDGTTALDRGRATVR
ncbi:MAG: MaoC family dehydratase N-terminal domain-containing protein [Intrasporangium sp.]|uniref:MaoC/PaaZ C-terminal domain-containing protein n=1 Tax=Intrasporangium sp. TaxID=1925024 RepID=UPI002649594D|nr:MaoC/PaaZ C-terminal domain-containing protein [Intrasporangium sp.]MDN5796929.1 MaoC family dehydratase N-terminal domain-containing protein [Intrasporangium sp.]